ncbi:class I SAM-dependent methyltransferase [Picosynechococcus sp. NKBG15041c]|uniref:class I SAM-dependent methyltransferase n=1 Tax=Picosynechococcus sp. NKBG15041c TaxID=1407650 RepID=UPI00040ABBC8|nr:class I SAM-dependent methyltransferase [Picosynechococcus sp. NKBG15041c]
MALIRILEPEVMDDPAEAIAYDAMDFRAVNQAFADLVAETYPQEEALVLDLGTGTAQIPILLGQQRPQWRIKGTDLAPSMLALGQQNVAAAGLGAQIELIVADAKHLPWPNHSFDVIMSNSLIHHLPDPLPCFREMARLLKPQGAIILRDLFRPGSVAEIDQIVAAAEGPGFDDRQRQLFWDSLHAAFTLGEIQAIAQATGLANAHIYQSSERHWTLIFPHP